MEQISITAFKDKFSRYSGSRIDVCFDIFTGIMSNSEEERVHLFTYACNNFGISDSDGSFVPPSSGISRSEMENLREMYGQTVDSLLDTLIQKSIKDDIDPELFYEKVWNLIIQNPIFTSNKEKAFALYYILIDTRIPYFQITPGLEMNNAEFKTIVEECKDDIQKAMFVLGVDFPQKTMEASNLLDILLSISDYRKRTVILSKIISELRDRNNQLIDSLLEKVKNEDK